MNAKNYLTGVGLVIALVNTGTAQKELLTVLETKQTEQDSEFCGLVTEGNERKETNSQLLNLRTSPTKDNVINQLNLYHPRTTLNQEQKDSLDVWINRDFAGYKNAHGEPIVFNVKHETIPSNIGDILDKIERENLRINSKNALLSGELRLSVQNGNPQFITKAEQTILGQRLRGVQDKYRIHITNVYIPENSGSSLGILVDAIITKGRTLHSMINIIQTKYGKDVNGKELQIIGPYAKMMAKIELRRITVHEIGHNTNLIHTTNQDNRANCVMTRQSSDNNIPYFNDGKTVLSSVSLENGTTITNYPLKNNENINEIKTINEGLLKILELGRSDKISNVPDSENAKKSTVYPNPTAGNITIELAERAKEALGREKLFMSLFSTQGQKIDLDIDQENGANVIDLNVDHLPNGIFTLRVFNEKGDVETIKFIINK